MKASYFLKMSLEKNKIPMRRKCGGQNQLVVDTHRKKSVPKT